MSKIVCLHSLTPSQEDLIRGIASGWELVHGKDKDVWLEHLKDAEIVVGWNSAAAEQILKPDAKLRWLQNWGAGVDKLPLDKLAAKGVILTTASGVHANPISETIFAMILSLARKVHISVRNQMTRSWRSAGELTEIHSQTIAIIGVGAIGEETAKLAKAFGMTVLGVRRSGKPSPYVDRMYDNSGLDETLQASDFVVVTLPETNETRHMFGRPQFQLMKPTSFFINIGRGGTTDTEALIEALQNGIIGGAGLDVFEQEPLPESSPLWELENVIITPHNSGSTPHYNERVISIFAQNLKEYIHGRELSVNRVDYKLQY
jgi:phosphoglycerate dehydrogenase-like enzyme